MILLDTHAVIWMVLQPELLSTRAKTRIEQAIAEGEALGCSVLALYEIVYGIQRGRIRLHVSVDEFCRAIQHQLAVLPITPDVAVVAGELRNELHGDPMDRMIVATALLEKCDLITADDRIRKAKVCKTLW